MLGFSLEVTMMAKDGQDDNIKVYQTKLKRQGLGLHM